MDKVAAYKKKFIDFRSRSQDFSGGENDETIDGYKPGEESVPELKAEDIVANGVSGNHDSDRGSFENTDEVSATPQTVSILKSHMDTCANGGNIGNIGSWTMDTTQ